MCFKKNVSLVTVENDTSKKMVTQTTVEKGAIKKLQASSLRNRALQKKCVSCHGGKWHLKKNSHPNHREKVPVKKIVPLVSVENDAKKVEGTFSRWQRARFL